MFNMDSISKKQLHIWQASNNSFKYFRWKLKISPHMLKGFILNHESKKCKSRTFKKMIQEQVQTLSLKCFLSTNMHQIILIYIEKTTLTPKWGKASWLVRISGLLWQFRKAWLHLSSRLVLSLYTCNNF